MNPYLPAWEYIPDGEPRVFGARLYLFGSHDRFGEGYFCPNPYVAWSAPVDNLSDWHYEGIIYRPEQDPLCEGHQLWAPDVTEGPDGRFYLYYCLSNEYPAIGVAVADAPAGPYAFYGHVHDAKGMLLGQRAGDTVPFDPGVFVDDDGQVYLYSGNGPGLLPERVRKHKGSRVMRLQSDMLTLAEEPRPLLPLKGESAGTGFEGHEFFEASSIRPFNGHYYLIYSSVVLHELCWAVSDAPDGPFAFGGVLVSNADLHPGESLRQARNAWGNNHGSVVKVGEQFYVFYHRHTNHGHFARQGMAERLEMDEAGCFAQAHMTSAGLAEALPARGSIPAGCACHLYGRWGQTIAFARAMRRRVPWITQDGPDFDPARLGEQPPVVPPHQYITNARHGFVALYRPLVLPGPTKVAVVVRGKAWGRLELRAGEDGPMVGCVKLAPSRTWKPFSTVIEDAKSMHELCLHFVGWGTFDVRELVLSDPE